MKKIILILFLMLFTSGICRAESNTKSVGDVDTKGIYRAGVEIKKAKISDTQTILDPGGYKGAKWGMTEDEVKGIITNVKWEKGFDDFALLNPGSPYLRYKDKILSHDAKVKFCFTDKRLSSVETEIEESDPDKRHDLFISLENLLMQKYGESIKWRRTIDNYFYKAEWVLLKTHIVLEDESYIFSAYIRIVYTELKEGNQEDKEKL